MVKHRKRVALKLTLLAYFLMFSFVYLFFSFQGSVAKENLEKSLLINFDLGSLTGMAIDAIKSPSVSYSLVAVLAIVIFVVLLAYVSFLIHKRIAK